MYSVLFPLSPLSDLNYYYQLVDGMSSIVSSLAEMLLRVSLLCVVCVMVVEGGIKIPRDECEWRQGGLGDMANRCDGDMLVVGACGSGFNNDCPGNYCSILSSFSHT